MRNPQRIKPLVRKLMGVWMANPDLRLGQLMFFVSRGYTETDIFYVEDDVMEEALDRELERMGLVEDEQTNETSDF